SRESFKRVRSFDTKHQQLGKQKTLSDLDNLFKLSKYYDMDIIGLLIEKEKSNPKEMDNLINSKKR
ncbi:hypothetical protein EHR29_09600, partial [Staphylococcus pseudintermedius]|nr:hypothetical protein [Staphylococcus pseudintermedius]